MVGGWPWGVNGGWQLAVGGPEALSLGAVRNKRKQFLKTALAHPRQDSALQTAVP